MRQCKRRFKERSSRSLFQQCYYGSESVDAAGSVSSAPHHTLLCARNESYLRLVVLLNDFRMVTTSSNQSIDVEIAVPAAKSECVVFPGPVKNTEKAIAMLGGMDGIADALKASNGTIKCAPRRLVCFHCSFTGPSDGLMFEQ